MKQLTKNIIFAVISIVLVVLIFGSGFYFGSEKSFSFNSRATAAETADLAAFWKVWNLLDSKFVGPSSTPLTTDEKVYGAIQGLVDSYGDPYTVFFPPKENKEFEETISGNFTGVGMEISVKDEVLTVVAPIKGSPAERAGIKSGDIIAKIHEKSTTELSLDESVSLIRGEPGTVVELTVLREGEVSPLVIEIERAIVQIPTLETELRSDGVFIISLFNFSAKADVEFREALREFLLSKSNKLVLDLRGNPGGFLDASIDITSWFLPAGKTIVSESFGGKKDDVVFRSKGYNVFNKNLKMVILVDKGSASASEIVAGALKDHGVATIVGTNTFGKGSVQELLDVTDDTSLKVTIAQWLTPNGISISDGGLSPDVEVEITKEDAEAEKDPQLDKAIEILLKK